MFVLNDSDFCLSFVSHLHTSGRVKDYRPQAVEDMSIREDTQHDVVSGGVMDKRPLGMHKEDIGNPDLLHQTAIKGHTLVRAASE